MYILLCFFLIFGHCPTLKNKIIFDEFVLKKNMMLLKLINTASLNNGLSNDWANYEYVEWLKNSGLEENCHIIKEGLFSHFIVDKNRKVYAKFTCFEEFCYFFCCCFRFIFGKYFNFHKYLNYILIKRYGGDAFNVMTESLPVDMGGGSNANELNSPTNAVGTFFANGGFK